MKTFIRLGILVSKSFIGIFFFFLIHPFTSFAQEEYIHTKEGKPILVRRQLIKDCLKSLNKDKSDATAVSICECQIEKMDRYFTSKQYKRYTTNHLIDINGLAKEDSTFQTDINNCYTSTGKTILLQAEGFSNNFISSCIKGIQDNTKKKLDIENVRNFCICQMDLVKSKKLTDADMESLSNPNSILFYEMMFKCGDPFSSGQSSKTNWTQEISNDITGPINDTLKILSLNGMTYVKIKIGSTYQFWLLDSGASDLLINSDMEEQLKKEKILTEQNYTGIAEYEMANGMIDTCRKYKIGNIKIGKYTVSNIEVAVTDKGKKIIAGKSLLNKFNNWTLSNKENLLILTK